MNSDSDKTFLEFFGKNLKAVRLRKEVTQKELAFSLGMEISQISRIERGLINTGIANVYRIARFLQVHPKELFEFTVPAGRQK